MPKPPCETCAIAGIDRDGAGLDVHLRAQAIELDLMQPVAPRRKLFTFARITVQIEAHRPVRRVIHDEAGWSAEGRNRTQAIRSPHTSFEVQFH